MAGSRQPVPLGSSLLSTFYPYGERHSHVWFLRHLASPSPTGVEYRFVSPDGRPKKGRSVITVVGQYDNPWGGSKAEIAALNDGKWSPSTRDFEALAANSGEKRSHIVDSLDAFLHLILDQPAFSIRRINIITHADSDGLGFGGEIDPEDGTVFFFVDDKLTEETLYHAYRYRRRNQFNKIEENFIVHRGKKLRFNDVMNRFGSQAEIFIYACNAGVNKDLTKAMARAFQVTVHAFDTNIDYWLPADEAKGIVERNNLRVAKHEGWSGQNTAKLNGVKDFHELTPNVQSTPADVYIFPSELERAQIP